LLAAWLAVGLAPAASAHAFLDRAEPAVGSTVTAAPAEVRMEFSEALEPAFSGAEVVDAHGDSVVSGKAAVDATDPKILDVKLKPLPAGAYSVHWHVVSVDTHRTEGNFTFTVAP
jgi:hypothetical protein